MLGRSKFVARTAVITGAGSGIGRAIAQSLARRGCDLALVDVNSSSLDQTASVLKPDGARITQHNLDLADARAIAQLPEQVMEAHRGVDLLVNNAGVALGGNFEQLTEEEFKWLFDINFWGVVRMTRAFLPLLRASGDGRIVNLSSLFGLISPPGQTAYSASKFAVRGFSNSLRFELGSSGVGVTVAHPGGVATSIARSARVPGTMPPAEAEDLRKSTGRLLRLRPEHAAEIIVRAVERRRSRVIVGSDAKLMSIVERLAPISYFGIFERWMTKSQMRGRRSRSNGK